MRVLYFLRHLNTCCEGIRKWFVYWKMLQISFPHNIVVILRVQIFTVLALLNGVMISHYSSTSKHDYNCHSHKPKILISFGCLPRIDFKKCFSIVLKNICIRSIYPGFCTVEYRFRKYSLITFGISLVSVIMFPHSFLILLI